MQRYLHLKVKNCLWFKLLWLVNWKRRGNLRTAKCLRPSIVIVIRGNDLTECILGPRRGRTLKELQVF